MISVLIVFHDSNIGSGATKSMLDLVGSWITSKEISITAMLPYEGSASKKLREMNVNTIICKYYNVRVNCNSTFYERKREQFKRVISIVSAISAIIKSKKLEYDYIYSNTGAIYVGYDLSRILKARHIWHVREFGCLDQERIQYDGEKKYCKKLNNSNRIIAISYSIKKYLISIGVQDSKISVVYNDVHSTELCERITSQEKNHFEILSCGGIQKNKGHLDVIKAVEIINKNNCCTNLLIAGNINTPYFPVLEEYVQKHELQSSVKFCGFVNDMNELREKCDIAVIASTKEAFGRVTIEAMLSKMLVIGANAGGTAELINDKENGLLFEPRDVKSLVNKITFAMGHWKDMSLVIESGYYFARQFNGDNAAKTISEFLINGQ